RYQDGIEKILAQCNELTFITDALLFIARAENTSVALRCEWLDMDRELGVLADYFTAPAEHAGIDLTLGGKGGMVWADRALLQRAVSNLIRNALTHTPRGSSVSIAGRGNSDAAWVEVRDNGPGLSEALLPKVFDRFQRGRESEGGAGLGLAIVKSVMDLHGGRVSLVSDRGLIARLDFPVPEGVVAPGETSGDVARLQAPEPN
ncbi:MAG: ATP-binding protein, partial [Terricaulis sp.]